MAGIKQRINMKKLLILIAAATVTAGCLSTQGAPVVSSTSGGCGRIYNAGTVVKNGKGLFMDNVPINYGGYLAKWEDTFCIGTNGFMEAKSTCTSKAKRQSDKPSKLDAYTACMASTGLTMK